MLQLQVNSVTVSPREFERTTFYIPPYDVNQSAEQKRIEYFGKGTQLAGFLGGLSPVSPVIYAHYQLYAQYLIGGTHEKS